MGWNRFDRALRNDDLARRALSGESEALSALVERWTPLLLAQARTRMGTHLRKAAEPEDLVQEAWLSVLGSGIERSAEHGADALFRRLVQAVRHRIIDLARRELRRAQHLAPQADARVEGIARTVTGAMTRLVRSERKLALDAALERLVDRERRIVVLRAIEGLPAEEIGLLLGQSANAIRVASFRALRRLRRELGPHFLG